MQSRNSMTLERIKYYRHLFGGALECIQSRLSKNPKPLCFSLVVTSACNCDCDFCFWKHKNDEVFSRDEMNELEEIKCLHSLDGKIYLDEKIIDINL